MTEDERDEQREPEKTEPESTEPEDGESDAPKPQTWAGRQRAGADEEADSAEEAKGSTEGFDGPEAESAELGEDLDSEKGEDAEEEAEQPKAAEAEEGEKPEAEEGEKPAPASAPTSQETLEADTLAEADREEKQEAAHKGVRERAEKSAAERVAATGAQAALAQAVAAAPAGTGEPPKRTLWWRFAAASVITITAMATATAVTFLLFLGDIAAELRDPELASARDELQSVEGKEPQTILILGSDKRSSTPGDPGRSDTAMLLRVDPEKEFLALLSLPRDLKVEIPGYGTDRLNAAYSYGEQTKPGGGEELAIKTIKELLDIPINHVVNVDFEGFYDAVNAIDCVYVDIDRHYYNPEGGDYDDIDIKPGYTRLCGYIALDYVRYRHGDNDIVRGARQQDFVREARQRIPPRELLPFIGGGDELINIFTENTTSDIDDVETIIEMLKSFVDVRDAPVRQVDLESGIEDVYVVASQDQVNAAVERFLGEDLEAEEPVPAETDEPREPKPKKKDKEEEPEAPAMIDATGTSAEFAKQFDGWLHRKKAKLPVFYPTEIVSNTGAAVTPESRSFQLAGPEEKEIYEGYKFVVSYQEPGFVSYYGVSGVNWPDPPILNNPTEVRRIDGRDYMLFYEQDRLRLVGWRTEKGAYWVINTLTRVLSEAEMLAVATSTREFDG